MSQIQTIQTEQLRVRSSAELGASIISMQLKHQGQWVDLMRPASDDALQSKAIWSFASFTLIPYSNRIKGGRLHFKGQEVTLKITENGADNAIHGEADKRAWRIASQTETSVSMEFQSAWYPDISWPWPFEAHMTVSVEGAELTVDMGVKNLSESEMPVGFGIHPYFLTRLTANETAVLTIPIEGIYPGEGTLPTGGWVPVSDELNFSRGLSTQIDFLDKCFRVKGTRSTIEWPESRITLSTEVDPVFEHAVLYFPKNCDEFFAYEPVTNCNDGFNLAEAGIEDTGSLVLAPGEAVGGRIVFSVTAEE